MFSEVTEVRDAAHLLTARARDEEIAEALIREMDWYDRYLATGSDLISSASSALTSTRMPWRSSGVKWRRFSVATSRAPACRATSAMCVS